MNTTASAAIQWTYENTADCVNSNNYNSNKYINNTTGTPGYTKKSLIKMIIANAGENKINFDFSALSASVYNLNSINESVNKTIRFVKQ